VSASRSISLPPDRPDGAAASLQQTGARNNGQESDQANVDWGLPVKGRTPGWLMTGGRSDKPPTYPRKQGQ
jgi:hypothetical protein